MISHRQRVLNNVDARSYTRGRGIGHAERPFLLRMLHLSHLGGLFGELLLVHIDRKFFALVVYTKEEMVKGGSERSKPGLDPNSRLWVKEIS